MSQKQLELSLKLQRKIKRIGDHFLFSLQICFELSGNQVVWSHVYCLIKTLRIGPVTVKLSLWQDKILFCLGSTLWLISMNKWKMGMEGREWHWDCGRGRCDHNIVPFPSSTTIVYWRHTIFSKPVNHLEVLFAYLVSKIDIRYHILLLQITFFDFNKPK